MYVRLGEDKPLLAPGEVKGAVMLLVKDLAICERPYEKAERYGVSALTDAELLSLIMRTGTRETSVIDLANQVLNAHDTQKESPSSKNAVLPSHSPPA